jgi:hypothetical protein
MKRSRALAAAILAALAGCVATTNPTSPGPENEIFTDLPALDGLKYDKGYGYKTPSGGLREYQQEYSGSRLLEDVKVFYEKALPQHGWMLKGSQGADPVTLTFEKKQEKVDVKIWNAGALLKVNVHVTGK